MGSFVLDAKWQHSIFLRSRVTDGLIVELRVFQIDDYD